MSSFPHLALALSALALAGCQSAPKSDLPAGAAAYALVPPPVAGSVAGSGLLARGDEIAVQVFQEPELSVARTRIDEAGMVSVPLLGEMRAADLSAGQFGAEIAARLGKQYLRNSQVTVSVLTAALVEATVEGEVNAPGVFAINRNETLLSALARAKSPTHLARDDEVFVFRQVDGQRMGARFDLAQIRTGRAADPQILGGDVIAVGYSAAKARFRDILQAAPLLNLFTVL